MYFRHTIVLVALIRANTNTKCKYKQNTHNMHTLFEGPESTYHSFDSLGTIISDGFPLGDLLTRWQTLLVSEQHHDLEHLFRLEVRQLIDVSVPDAQVPSGRRL
jgi:hypothetical protein